MVSTRLIAAAAFVTAAFVVPVSSANAEADAESLVNALNAVFGKHDGMRAAHTNGICVKGSFKPTSGSGELVEGSAFFRFRPVSRHRPLLDGRRRPGRAQHAKG